MTLRGRFQFHVSHTWVEISNSALGNSQKGRTTMDAFVNEAIYSINRVLPRNGYLIRWPYLYWDCSCTQSIAHKTYCSSRGSIFNHNEQLDDAAQQSIITSCRYRSRQASTATTNEATIVVLKWIESNFVRRALSMAAQRVHRPPHPQLLLLMICFCW